VVVRARNKPRARSFLGWTDGKAEGRVRSVTPECDDLVAKKRVDILAIWRAAFGGATVCGRGGGGPERGAGGLSDAPV